MHRVASTQMEIILNSAISKLFYLELHHTFNFSKN